jgi:hypothetical protein
MIVSSCPTGSRQAGHCTDEPKEALNDEHRARMRAVRDAADDLRQDLWSEEMA